MTRWTGTCGLIFAASPPSLVIASRIAARSTTQGTPVKSCISTRAGRYWISRLGGPGPSASRRSPGRRPSVTVLPSSKRSMFSSSTFIEKGRRLMSPNFSAALASAEIIVGLAADVERGAGVERVLADGGHSGPSHEGPVERGGEAGTRSPRTGAPGRAETSDFGDALASRGEGGKARKQAKRRARHHMTHCSNRPTRSIVADGSGLSPWPGDATCEA